MVPPLASRATHAAWPSDAVQRPVQPNRIVSTEPPYSDQGTLVVIIFLSFHS